MVRRGGNERHYIVRDKEKNFRFGRQCLFVSVVEMRWRLGTALGSEQGKAFRSGLYNEKQEVWQVL